VTVDVSFAAIDRGTEMFQGLRRALDLETFGINLMVLQPGKRLRVHTHERQDEVYLVLEGTLTLLVEGAPHELGVDQLARVGPGTRRQVTNPTAEKVVILALGAAGKHEGRDGLAWSSWDDEGPGREPRDVPLPEDLPISE
jgi:mannose-6-phosphate isomerase-like protein (cupin superfamily)